MKRLFDVIFSMFGLFVFFPIIIVGWVAASISTMSNGFYIQKRVGKHGKKINVVKLKTMKNSARIESSITALNSSRITRTGKFLRKTKLDELPQLFNVLFGQMSFVGPRPDVPGYADKLEGNMRQILEWRPGITGLATVYFKYEEELLNQVDDPKRFNDTVVYPLKVLINIEYINRWSVLLDLDLIIQTIIGRSLFSSPIKPFLVATECTERLEKYKC